MIDIIKRDFLKGWKNFKFWAQTLSDRLKREINILRLLLELNKLNEERDKVLIELGTKVYKSGKTSLELSDEEFLPLLRKLKEIDSEIENNKKKISDLGSID